MELITDIIIYAITAILIGICGGTGSGKSTIVKKLEKQFKSKGVVKILSDSYYKNFLNLNFKEIFF